jgi:DNA mismatch repair protein MutL
VLPADVISRIAAGEVIERPAAVVKELIENSLDAGSRHIIVDIKDGGTSLIRVTDDGQGIPRSDLPLAFERHATSKLKSDADLASIGTMGFRGEALPSIASVSKVLVTTATNEEQVGAQLSLIGGVPQHLVDAPAVIGTRIEVSDLFYNQPARKKFLKSIPTEFSHISTVVQQAALAWPFVHFRLTHNGQEVLNHAAVASDRDRILQVYRQPFLERTVEVRGFEGATGSFCKPTSSPQCGSVPCGQRRVWLLAGKRPPSDLCTVPRSRSRAHRRERASCKTRSPLCRSGRHTPVRTPERATCVQWSGA